MPKASSRPHGVVSNLNWTRWWKKRLIKILNLGERRETKRKSKTEFNTSCRNRTIETRKQRRKTEKMKNKEKRKTSKSVSRLLIGCNCSLCLIYWCHLAFLNDAFNIILEKKTDWAVHIKHWNMSWYNYYYVWCTNEVREKEREEERWPVDILFLCYNDWQVIM